MRGGALEMSDYKRHLIVIFRIYPLWSNSVRLAAGGGVSIHQGGRMLHHVGLSLSHGDAVRPSPQAHALAWSSYKQLSHRDGEGDMKTEMVHLSVRGVWNWYYYYDPRT